jgi:hypothetical protein
MSNLALTELVDSDSTPNLVAGSEQAVIELVGLRWITRQSTVPEPVPVVSSETGDSPLAAAAEAAPLGLTPTEPVLFEAPLASTDSSVCNLAKQTKKIC